MIGWPTAAPVTTPAATAANCVNGYIISIITTIIFVISPTPPQPSSSYFDCLFPYNFFYYRTICQMSTCLMPEIDGHVSIIF